MNCPDMERLIEIGLGQAVAPELNAHIQACGSCQADLRTIGALAGSSAEEREMSEDLISQIIAGLPEPDTPSRLDWARGIQLCLTWGLGFVTAVVSVVGTGSIGQVSRQTALLLAVGFGGVCALVNLRAGLQREPANGGNSPPEPA